MKGAVLLPYKRPSQWRIQQAVKRLAERLGKTDDFVFFCIEEEIPWYSEALKGRNIQPATANCLIDFELIVNCTESIGVPSWYPFEIAPGSPKRRFRLSLQLGINERTADDTGVIVNEEEYPALNSNVFTRLASRGVSLFEDVRGYSFFPYGFTYRHLGAGPINEFGLRIDKPLSDFENRSSDHKLIACFGGSSTFSIECLHSEMFTSILEKELNALLSHAKRKEKVSVLNFGQNSHVLLNQITTYVLHCHKIKPDIVISHDGVNDLLWGQIVDPSLVVDHGIVYQDNFEQWAQIIHKSEDRPTTQQLSPINPFVHIKTSAKVVADVYFQRKKQFMELVTGVGSRFVWGLQPIVFNKQKLSDEEKIGFGFWTKNSSYAPAIRNLEKLFRMIEEQYPIPSTALNVNFSEAFGRHDESSSLFSDHCHLFPQGDEIVGKIYAKKLFDRFFNE